MQSTGHTSTQAWSTQSRQRLVITQGIVSPFDSVRRRAPARRLRGPYIYRLEGKREIGSGRILTNP
jgi:hypothetical protein